MEWKTFFGFTFCHKIYLVLTRFLLDPARWNAYKARSSKFSPSRITVSQFAAFMVRLQNHQYLGDTWSWICGAEKDHKSPFFFCPTRNHCLCCCAYVSDKRHIHELLQTTTANRFAWNHEGKPEFTPISRLSTINCWTKSYSIWMIMTFISKKITNNQNHALISSSS